MPLVLASCISSDRDELADTTSLVLVDRVGIVGHGGCDYATVTAAIADAVDGETILVEEGATFFERLGTITKDVIIRSGTVGCGGASATNAPKPTIDAQHVGKVARIAADVTFQQIILSNGKVMNPLDEGPGGNLWIESGTTTLIDAIVIDGESRQDTWGGDLNPYGAGIHMSNDTTVLVQGSSQIIGNTNENVGAGGVLVGEGAFLWLQDDSIVGYPLFGANVALQGAGGVYVMGDVMLNDRAEIAGNIAQSFPGGALHIAGGSVWLFDDTGIEANTARDGGGIYLAEGYLYASDNVEIRDNDAVLSDGGAIYVAGGGFSLEGVTIAGNEAQGCGGALYVADSDLSSINDSTIDDNSAGECGGGIAMVGGGIEMQSTTISNNTAGTDGGGIHKLGIETVLDLDSVTVRGNTAARGGGIALGITILTTASSLIDDNEATGDGGGVWISGAGTQWVDGSSQVTDNAAASGGGIFADSGVVELQHTQIDRNHVASGGGGIRLTGYGEIELRNGSVNNNTAESFGAGFAVQGGELRLLGTNVSSNAADGDGGGGYIASGGRVETQSVWFNANSAAGRGGGIAMIAYFASEESPVLEMAGPRNQEGCFWRGAIAINEYCSEIRGNTAVIGGGGMYIEDGTAVVDTTAIRQNTAPIEASAVWMRSVPTGSPSVFADNLLIAKNGNVPNVDSIRVMGGNFNGNHITSTENLGVPFRFGPFVTTRQLRRSIVWDTASAINDSVNGLAATCTLFRDLTGQHTGTNVLEGPQFDPVFVTTGRGKYRLGGNSINAVNQCSLSLTYDLDSDPRPVPVGGQSDRGAFERQ
ncbi:MAG TPA: hypothetical protein VIU61_23985 [Kofleriaceae bacterium]